MRPRPSHLLQMRGLKLQRDRLPALFLVASFTDAWIETWFHKKGEYRITVASFTDAWIETYTSADWVEKVASRIFYRCVD